MFRDIQSIHQYLAEHRDSVFDLDAIKNLLDLLHHPEQNISFVHITGTNGKGSTGAYLQNILIESGYKVGSFSSPAVCEYNEIIKLNDISISDDDIISLFGEIYEAIELMQARGMRHPTAFEIETAMAFLYFKRENVDIAIVEVGMGGALDSTNIIENTLVELITRISYDHMGILGKTLREIATNKSGIVKSGSTLVTTMQDSEVMNVLNEKCKNVGAEMLVAGDGVNLGTEDGYQIIGYKGRDYRTALLGAYQVYNLPIALEAAHVLKSRGYDKITHDAMHRGVERTRLMGRFEIIGREPIFILDGAHNDEASQMLRESLDRYFQGKKLIYILGIFEDKDYNKVIDNTIRLASEVITFDWDNPRHMRGEKLRDIVSQRMANVIYAGSIENAVRQALEDAENRDVIVAFGSLSHLNEIKKAYKGVKTNG